MKVKVLSFFVVILAIYALGTLYITIDNLKASPEQLFKSETVKPEIIQLTTEAISSLTNEFGNLNFVVAFTQERKAILLVPNSEDFKTKYGQSSLEEVMLQYVSGSNVAFATNCPSSAYKHGTCYGPIYDGDTLVVPRTCSCVLK